MAMNFVPCMAWVRRGVSKEMPEKVQLSKEELAELIKDAKENYREALSEDENEESNVGEEKLSDDEMKKEKGDCSDEDIVTAYDLDAYDDEEDGDGPLASLAGLTVYSSKEEDPYVTLNDEASDSDEEDDFRIRPDDNLIAVGHVEDDASLLEIYVYNRDADHLYVHHHYLLPAYPLALEWLDFDISDSSKGNFLAVGDMTPVISIWDLDMVDSLEPAFKLGKKIKKKKKKTKLKGQNENSGHTDAVLALAWNKKVRNFIGSGSADNKIHIWDLSTSTVAASLSHHTDKVQALDWHSHEAQTLLSGSCDKSAKLYDCRDSSSCKSWTFEGEVEKAIWNNFDPFYFAASTDTGHIYYVDTRTTKPVFTLKAHQKAVTGLAFSSQCPGCVISASEDKTVKVWDFSDNNPELILDKNPVVGNICAVQSCPDSPFVYAVGGDKRDMNFKVIDTCDENTIVRRFGSRPLMVLEHESSNKDEDMEVETVSKENS